MYFLHGQVDTEKMLRNRSLIKGRGAGLPNGKNLGLKLYAPPPSRQDTTFCAPPPPFKARDTIFPIFVGFSTSYRFVLWILGTSRVVVHGKRAQANVISYFLMTSEWQPCKWWELFSPPVSMAKTSSFRVKTTPKRFVPLPSSAWLELCLPPLFVGQNLTCLPIPLCSPPPPRNYWPVPYSQRTYFFTICTMCDHQHVKCLKGLHT